MNATYTLNEAHKGIEITFTVKPVKSTLDSLKASGFRWHSQKKLWYAKQTEERLQLVKQIAEGKTTEAKPEAHEAKKAEAVNKYGVKVGDVFHMVWGYDQTNNDFFQVVKLCGSSSVRVVEVLPQFETVDAYGLAEDRVYKFNGEMLPRNDRSIFIEDKVNGDIKRLTSFYQDGRPQIKIHDHYCDKVEGELKTYESWYA